VIPPVRECSFPNTHRLIPSKYSPGGTVFLQLSNREQEVQELIELDGATNARLLGEEGLLPDISVHELLYGVAYSEVVNSAFAHAAPNGRRFNSCRRGAWYAGLDRETSIAEVAFHKWSSLMRLNGGLRKYPPTRLPRGLRHCIPRSAGQSPATEQIPQSGPDSAVLSRVAAVSCGPAYARVQPHCLSKCPIPRWNLRCLFSSSAGLSCAPGLTLGVPPRGSAELHTGSGS